MDSNESPDGSPQLSMLNVGFSLTLFAFLFALLLPAIARTRERAYALRCQDNLAVLSAGIHLYADAHGLYPNTDLASANWWITPYLNLPQHPIRSVARYETHAVMLCPSLRAAASEPRIGGEWLGYLAGTSYGATRGVVDRAHGRGFAASVLSNEVLAPTNIRDGMTTTLLFAELIPSVATTPKEKWMFRSDDDLASMYHNNIKRCESDSPQPGIDNPYRGVGVPWTGATSTAVCQDRNPGQRSCFLSNIDIREEYFLASDSFHAGVVHVAFMDGRVKITSTSIDSYVWRAFGTVAGDDAGPE